MSIDFQTRLYDRSRRPLPENSANLISDHCGPEPHTVPRTRKISVQLQTLTQALLRAPTQAEAASQTDIPRPMPPVLQMTDVSSQWELDSDTEKQNAASRPITDRLACYLNTL